MLGIAAGFKELFRLAKQFVRESHSQPASSTSEPGDPAKPSTPAKPND